MAATYDISTSVGRVRFYIGDTDTANALFQDEEISFVLSDLGSDVKSAAIRMLRVMLANIAVLPRLVEIGRYQTEEQAANDIRAIISDLESELDGGGIQTGTLAASDETLESYVPEWVAENETEEFML